MAECNVQNGQMQGGNRDGIRRIDQSALTKNAKFLAKKD